MTPIPSVLIPSSVATDTMPGTFVTPPSLPPSSDPTDPRRSSPARVTSGPHYHRHHCFNCRSGGRRRLIWPASDGKYRPRVRRDWGGTGRDGRQGGYNRAGRPLRRFSRHCFTQTRYKYRITEILGIQFSENGELVCQPQQGANGCNHHKQPIVACVRLWTAQPGPHMGTFQTLCASFSRVSMTVTDHRNSAPGKSTPWRW